MTLAVLLLVMAPALPVQRAPAPEITRIPPATERRA